jgi:glycosyltransferase involved in cell wall biosynthesis
MAQDPLADRKSTSQPTAAPFLSIVIPAHNEEHRLGPTLERISAYLDKQPYDSEVLVVENGSSDRTLELAQQFAARWPRLRALKETQRGKGLAVRRGMVEARGQYRFLCDADLSMPIEDIERFLPPRLSGIGVAIGSREAKESTVVEPWRRRLIGRVFNTMVRLLVLRGIRDTQCGFKCFSAAAADAVFRRQRLDGLTFDVEVLYIARRHGFEIAEVPITWTYDADTRVRMGSDSYKMARDLLAIRRNARKGLYD